MNICHLVCAGMFFPQYFRPDKDDFIIACDGGLKYLDDLGVTPDLVVGDFDSLGHKPETPAPVISLPAEKDDTDALFAAKEALKRGYRYFIVHGALWGPRISHSVASFALLSFLLDKEAKGCLYAKDTIALLFDPGKFILPAVPGYISFFPYGGPCRITLSGVKYPYDGLLDYSMPLGISNEFARETAYLTVRGGRVICILESPAVDKYYAGITETNRLRY